MGSAQTPSSAPPVKLALVIGNADYDGGGIDVTPQGVAESTAGGYVPDLRNPINDATDIRDALARIGFKVDFVTDADGPAMSAALATFGTKVAEAPDTAQVVIYYAGHAMQVDGVNYLIPARARLPTLDYSRASAAEVQAVLGRELLIVDLVLKAFQSPLAPGVNLLVLDSCRTNPWSQIVAVTGRGASAREEGVRPVARGMSRLEASTPRTVVLFSTAPGAVAQDGLDRNSPFTAALKRWIGKPGNLIDVIDGAAEDVSSATRGGQTPWFQSGSLGSTCLVSCVAPRANDRSEFPAPPPPSNTPAERFRECDVCPEMVVLPGGKFKMGSPNGEGQGDEHPQREVTIRSFAAGRFEITLAEWDACLAGGGCASPEEGPWIARDNGWGRGNRPVLDVRWADAKRYVRWLNNRVGGQAYRLLTEAEWEYAARAGTTTTYSTGASIARHQAQFQWRFANPRPPEADAPRKTAPVGSFPPNQFGLYDMHGNVAEWVEDCAAAYWHLPSDASARNGTANTTIGCPNRISRGGSFMDRDVLLASARRQGGHDGPRWNTGFRVARDLGS
jgi:formylglycine-generating enzyme required for sulfatase activity